MGNWMVGRHLEKGWGAFHRVSATWRFVRVDASYRQTLEYVCALNRGQVLVDPLDLGLDEAFLESLIVIWDKGDPVARRHAMDGYLFALADHLPNRQEFHKDPRVRTLYFLQGLCSPTYQGGA